MVFSNQKGSNGSQIDSSEEPDDRELAAAFDELNRVWEKAEDLLVSWKPQIEASVQVSQRAIRSRAWDEPEHMAGIAEEQGPWKVVSLVLTKYQGQWRICKRVGHLVEHHLGQYPIPVPTDSEDHPVLECSSEDRIELVPFLEKLVTAVRKRRRQKVEEIRAAIAQATAVLENSDPMDS